MRVPLIRFGTDETPLAWWEWLFGLIMSPLIFLVLLVAAVASAPVALVDRLQKWREEKRLRRRLTAAGRFMEWSAVEAKLKAGDGTLIVEYRSPKGPNRVWWAEEDLIALAPIALPASHESQLQEGKLRPLQEYAASCADRYTDTDSGSAKLTELPRPMLSTTYPASRAVTLVTWLGEPIVFAGDAKTVCRAEVESSSPLESP